MFAATETANQIAQAYTMLDTPFRAIVVLMPVDHVMRVESCDGLDFERTMLDKLSDSGSIERFIDSLLSDGFLMPVTMCNGGSYRHGDDEWIIGNGNHRIATAIALGYQHIPVALIEGKVMDTFDVSDGSFHDLVLEAPLHHETPATHQQRSPYIERLRAGGWVK